MVTAMQDDSNFPFSQTDFDFLRQRNFDFELIDYPTLEATKDLLNSYKVLKSTELWSLNIVDNTLNQIEYQRPVGLSKQPQFETSAFRHHGPEPDPHRKCLTMAMSGL